MRTRVVLAMDSATRRALTRLGLEMSGGYDVVGIAVDEDDVDFIVGTLRPDVVVVDFAQSPGRGLAAVSVVRAACRDAVPVLYDALVGRHHAETGRDETPRPAQVAALLDATLGTRIPVAV